MKWFPCFKLKQFLLVHLFIHAGCAAKMEVVGLPDQASFSSAGALLPATATRADVLKACSERAVQQATFPIHFPRETAACPWNSGDNLGMRDLHFQARIEQNGGFTLPAGAVVCDMRFVFGTNNFYYDDEFIFTYKGLVLASSFDFTQRFTSEGNFARYNWGGIRGLSWQSVPQRAYCAGANRGLGVCSWPATSVQGPFTVNYGAELIQEITALTKDDPTYNFGFITTGDNDPASDCRHEPLNFQVDVTYVR